MEKDRYVTAAEASTIVGYKEQTLANWRFRGVGPCYTKRGNSIRYKISDLMDFMASGRIDPERRHQEAGLGSEEHGRGQM
jgi:hypothetical protein